MPTSLLITIILIVGCSTSAYVTARICDHDFNSSWQVIAYTSSEVVVPKEIYICKHCYEKADINYRYCHNCGARMRLRTKLIQSMVSKQLLQVFL